MPIGTKVSLYKSTSVYDVNVIHGITPADGRTAGETWTLDGVTTEVLGDYGYLGEIERDRRHYALLEVLSPIDN
ncbi:hypothetical protein [Leifsonia sp. Le1]|uniref:hypothetical protein n=1 Tax=Leifsonia sp. Le1 TaxID=3404918 RepID=UPI003EB7A090